MTELVVSAAAVACLLTAIEGLIVSIGKWRGLIAAIFAPVFCLILGVSGFELLVYSLAATFLGLTASLAIEQAFTGVSVREMRGLPRRVDRL